MTGLDVLKERLAFVQQAMRNCAEADGKAEDEFARQMNERRSRMAALREEYDSIKAAIDQLEEPEGTRVRGYARMADG